MTSLTDAFAHKTLNILAYEVGFGFLVALFEVRNYTLINSIILVAIAKLYMIFFVASTVENHFNCIIGKLANRRAHRKTMAFANRSKAL